MSSINISQDNVQGNCDLKCSYNFKYLESSTIAKNQGVCIKLTYDNINGQSIVYNNQPYNVSDISIVSPSIHIFNNATVNAEIIIKHSPVTGGNFLFVCIPIIKSSESSTATNLITHIIQLVASNAPRVNETTNINISGFTLESIVPIKPFFSYTNSSDTSPGDYIVFNVSNAIPLKSSTLVKLSNIIKPFPVSTPGDMLFYNSTGPNSSGSSVNDDGIYISCKPTGTADDELGVEFAKTDISYDMSIMTILKLIIGCIIFIVTIVIFNYMYMYYTSNKTTKELWSNLKNKSNSYR